MDSFQDRLLWFDDFHGDQLQDEWRTGGVGGGAVVVDAQTGGIVRLTTGAVNGNQRYIDWQDIRSLHVDQRASMEVRLKPNQATYTFITIELRFDVNNRIRIYAFENAGGATNWWARCTNGGAQTSEDTLIALDTNYHIFRIECHTHGASHVHFYIDGTETDDSPITTNVPDDAADFLQPDIQIVTQENVAKSCDVDYVYIRQERT